MTMTISMLQKLAQDDAARIAILSMQKAQLDQDNLYHQARNEGSEERAKKMVRTLAKQGVDLSIISVAAELPVERVKELLDDE